ncbi:unnamed protein product [Didymodactylos carnosus]|uniref:Uncharacterized protein n=1 Tax=Didymodactylos carnosus TaxID=1234261 RepID=A0A8S2E386_9BILA|nr:unnamed protein product [Didymodactylos carnosus]CAF3895839.1 unnamed protein product [Didymodactylos carnosus]
MSSSTTLPNSMNLFLVGSTASGHSSDSHFAGKKASDIDMCMEIGRIHSENELIKTSKPSFVRIRWNPVEETLKSKPYSNDQNNQHCINGYKMKENVQKTAEYNDITYNMLYDKTKPIQSTPESAALNVKLRWSNSNVVSTSQSFSDTLTDVLNIQQQEEQNNEQLLLYKNNFVVSFQITNGPLFSNIRKQLDRRVPINDVNYAASLLCPIFLISLTREQKLKATMLINFYLKYQYLVKAYIRSEQRSNYRYPFFAYEPYDYDFVPSFKLEFWPQDIEQGFLKRFKHKKPNLYEQIKQIFMHLVAKWSGNKETCQDRELEFRYSFSSIELFLANARTKTEQMLNGIARSIYYRYLYKKNNDENSQHSYIKSYFIATTVFWMCEEKNLNDLDVENEQYSEDVLETTILTLKFHVNLNDPLGLELVQALKQTEPYNYGNTNNFWKNYIHDISYAENEYKYIKLIWGDDESEDFEYLLDVLVPFYRIDNQETNNWLRWKKLFIDKDFANDDDDELVRTSLFHNNEANNKSTMSPKLFTFCLCLAVSCAPAIIQSVTNQHYFEHIVRMSHDKDHQSFLSNVNFNFDNFSRKTDIYSKIANTISSSSTRVRLYSGLVLPTLFEHNLSFVFNNRTVLTDHVEGSETHDVLDLSCLYYVMRIIMINNLDIQYPHLRKLFLSSTILKLLIDYRPVLQEIFPSEGFNGILSTAVFEWLCQKSNENSDHDGIFYSDWCLLVPLFIQRNTRIDRFSCLSDENIIAIFEDREKLKTTTELSSIKHCIYRTYTKEDIIESEKDFFDLCEMFFTFIEKAIMILEKIQYDIKQKLTSTISITNNFGRKTYYFQYLLRLNQINELEKIINGNINENNQSKNERLYERAFILFFFEEIMHWLRDQDRDINKRKEINVVCHAYLWYLTQNSYIKYLNGLNSNRTQCPLQSDKEFLDEAAQKSQQNGQQSLKLSSLHREDFSNTGKVIFQK